MSRIDLNKIAGLDKKSKKRRMRRAALAIQAEWRRRAPDGEYARNVQITEISEDHCKVELHGTVPNIKEQGMGPGGIGTQGSYDIRKFVLKPGTRNLRRDKDGMMYVNVPFGHTEESIAAQGGQRALRAAQALKPTMSQAGGPTLWGGKMPAGMAAKLKRWHAHDPLEGMVRQQKTYAAATQSTYKTWRVMSQAGAPWMSKGVKGKHIAKAITKDLHKILAEVL